MDWLNSPEAWIALVTLTFLEIVLGIDNIVFISILVGKLDAGVREKARRIGLLLAMVMRVLLLFSIAWLTHLTDSLFAVLGNEISGRDLILLVGGIFLLAKSTHEIHNRLEGEGGGSHATAGAATFAGVLMQIALLDLVFSIDSVITAVGMAEHLSVMVAAIVMAVLFMMVFARAIGDFVDRHPTVKMLALSFLLLVGVALIADAFDQHLPRGYIYFAMGFSVFVEFLNLRAARRRKNN
jgi:predicted tellurium resistance membrane protein TerC